MATDITWRRRENKAEINVAGRDREKERNKEE